MTGARRTWMGSDIVYAREPIACAAEYGVFVYELLASVELMTARESLMSGMDATRVSTVS